MVLASLLLAAFSLGPSSAAPAPYDIAYSFRSPDPASHLGDVTVTVGARDADTVAFQLPAWYPGRYAIYNFAANVQEVRARCGGAEVPTARSDVRTWIVRCPARTPVELAYRVWWNDLNGSMSQIDSTHVNLNPGNTFVYVVGHKPDPVRVRYEGPAGWRVINGAAVAEGNGDPSSGPEYRFPNYDVMIDHPTEISAAFTVDSFTVGRVNYRVMIHTDPDPGAVRPRLVRDVERIVRAHVAMWGDPPVPSYTFMMHYLDGNGGDGMEHLTSTHVSRPVSLASLADTASYFPALGVISHEFFHTWSMKRLRAAELGPWDYTRENPTTTLWIGEGITNYYGVRNLRRSGVWDDRRYRERAAGAVTQLQSRPGRKIMSAQESSWNAWYIDAVPLRQKTNHANSTISYYNKGEVLGWLLDLDLRARTQGKQSLDDVMRLMWRRFWEAPAATYYLQGRGYTDADFLQALNEVGGADYADFFRRYVADVEELPYAEILGRVGLVLETNEDGHALRLDEASPHAALGRAWLEGK